MTPLLKPLIGATLAFACMQAAAQAWPTRAVRFVVPSAAGGGTDIVTRVLAQKLADTLGQPFVVENRAGAGQMIGTELVARAPADGYAILMASSTLAINPVMYRKISYDAVRDFAPVTQVASLPNVLVAHPSLPAKTVAELVALAKQKPGQVNYASAGVGTSPHMSMELFKSMAGVDLAHIPYKGTAPAVTDVLGGQVPVMMANVLTALPHLKSGKLRALAVTGTRHAESLPDVPTMAEAGAASGLVPGLKGYEAIQWYGVLAPAGTARDIVVKLQAEVARALKLADVRERLAADGAEPVGSSPEQFAALIRSELEKWATVARNAGIKPE